MNRILKHTVTISFLPLLLIAGCKENAQIKTENQTAVKTNQNQGNSAILPPLKHAFSCLPKDAAFIAAHRGTSRNAGLAENSLIGQKTLIEKGFYFSEIDVAGLKDGTLILMHDGVLDRTTVKTGPVASATWADLDGTLLKDTDGELTSDIVPKFSDILEGAKGQIYLEIDFKSSARFEDVIKEIRKQGMADQVILIAYSDGQARKLAKLAPEMMLSLTVKNAEHLKELNAMGIETAQMAAWTGRERASRDLLALLSDKNVPALAMRNPQEQTKAISDAHLIVSDYALDSQPIIGDIDMNAFKACLNK